jgi:hypothetical protein
MVTILVAVIEVNFMTFPVGGGNVVLYSNDPQLAALGLIRPS